MQDLDLTLDNGEDATVRSYLGEVPAAQASVFVWKESSDKISVAIDIEGQQKISLEISDRGNRIEVKYP